MADVYAVFGTLIALGIAYPGTLTTWWLLFPAAVERAQVRIEEKPWRCFWLGLGTALILAVPITVLIAIPWSFAKFLGGILFVLVLGLSGIGAAGIALQMAQRLAPRAHPDLPAARAFVTGAVALELAIAFPIVGWFIVWPITTVVALGATVSALLLRRHAKASTPSIIAPTPAQA